MLRSKYLFLPSLLFFPLCSCSALMQNQESIDAVAMTTARVDAIPGPSLRLSPQRIDVETGDEFHLELIAEEVIDLMGVKAVFQFDPDKLSILDIQEGGFLSSNKGRVSRYHIVDESLGVLEINVETAAGSPPGVTGTGTIALIKLKSLKSTTQDLSFNTEETVMWNSSQSSIPIAEFMGASISATELWKVPGNLLKNPSADDGQNSWYFGGGSAGTIQLSNGNKVFWVDYGFGKSGQISQTVDVLPADIRRKYILVTGYAWIKAPITFSTTANPCLWGTLWKTNSTQPPQTLQCSFHTASAGYWETIYGIFRVKKINTSMRIELFQSRGVGNPPDGTRAMFDDIQMFVYSTKQEAKDHLSSYQKHHPTTAILPKK